MNSFGIIGGDLRLAYLAEMLAEENVKVYIYAFEKYNFNNFNIIKCENIKQLEKVEKIVTAIPLSKDKVLVNSPFSSLKLKIEDIFNKINNKKIISGGLNSEISEKAKKNKNEIIDILQNEELAVLNAIPTAEGAIQIAMEKSNITLHNNNCLVMGFGRIGKVLAKMLTGIGANVFCEARKDYDIAEIKAYGYNAIKLENLKLELGKFNYIFNTIPKLILDKEKLLEINKNCIIIDLASAPGGVDFEFAKELGINATLNLALPGKVAPETSAKYLKQCIEKI